MVARLIEYREQFMTPNMWPFSSTFEWSEWYSLYHRGLVISSVAYSCLSHFSFLYFVEEYEVGVETESRFVALTGLEFTE